MYPSHNNSWRRRDDRQEKHHTDKSERILRPCRNFIQSGSCKFGEKCHFSHTLTTDDNPKQYASPWQPEILSTEQLQVKAKYDQWKRLLKTPPGSAQDPQSRRIWSGGLAILDSGDGDGWQKLPNDLDIGDWGRKHILSLMSTAITSHDIGLVKDFLLLFTHHNLIHSLALDSCVGSLYNFISGANGTRAIPFFKRICGNLTTIHKFAEDDHNGDEPKTILVSLVTFLREVLRREQRSRFHEDLPVLIDEIKELVVERQKLGISLYSLDSDIIWIRHISVRARENLLDNETQLDEGNLTNHQPLSTYPSQIEFPGGRHDNDHLSITKIEIFPTSDELRSDQPEFLPSADFAESTFLADRAEWHIDTQFRLLRYDIFRELKIALGGILYMAEQNLQSMKLTRPALSNLSVHQYPGAYISGIEFNGRRGLELSFTFPLPDIPSLRKNSIAERHRWWDESRRLANDVLLSFVVLDAGQVHHIFLEVVGKSKSSSRDSFSGRSEGQISVTTKLASHRRDDLEIALRSSCAKSNGTLLEFPKIISPTFRPILENLQRMHEQSRLPFQDYILPATLERQRLVTYSEVRTPAYARKPGFAFSLKSIMRSGADHPLLVDSNTRVDDDLLKAMEEGTTLDLRQCEALVSALTKEFAFIQGPPGTGKSYLGVQLMKVLLYNKYKVELGPIIVVCYTNHALDQFLEHLIETGIPSVVRIGGSSRSDLLKHHNLREICQPREKTKFENSLASQTYEKLDVLNASIAHGLAKIHGLYKKQPREEDFTDYFDQEEPEIYNQFVGMNDEGWQVAGKGSAFEIWANVGASTTEESNATAEILLQQARVNVYNLPKPARTQLLRYWISKIHLDLSNHLFEETDRAFKAFRELSNIHDETKKRILENADVIGVTTTGLAKNITLLQYVNAKVVICEEAGEVMEPHMLSTLLPSVEHLIQIGDHQQLRPQINSHSLSLESQAGRRYQLDRSQFERLIIGKPGEPKIPVVQLNVQRRMRPEISNLIRETIYPRLVDHDDTLCLDDVVGLRSNVLWLDHRHHEETQQSDLHHRSHSNDWEVSMVQALIRHIIRQGKYKSEDIAVLAPYMGQVSKLRKVLNEEYEIVLNDRDEEALENDGFTEHTIGQSPALVRKTLSSLLRLATVDNFQGEEAKVVIISLVRSNSQQNVGFLKTTNRINVALSRAKHGMYLIGNSETYSGTPMWAEIIGMLKMNDSIKDHIELCCPRHRDTSIEVREPDDFQRLSPEGGCKEKCPWRLDCGHMCQAPCHSQSMHDIFDCSEPCQRLHPNCEHPCQQPTCGLDCGQCNIVLQNVKLPCGHHQDIQCYKSRDLERITCTTIVKKYLPGCWHSMNLPCFRQNEVASSKDCDTPCDGVLECGHSCPGKCRDCRKVGPTGLITLDHQSCQSNCKRPYTECGHICGKKCHHGESCGPCMKPCEVRCQHSRCTKSCGEACAPCVETCTWSCDHQGVCTMPCGGPCTRLPCNERCPKLLSCGHRCPGVCGESCPEAYCQQCGHKLDERVDLLEMKLYSEIDVDENPIIVLSCGHFFTIETLDGMIGIDKVYSIDQQGNFIGTADISRELIEQVPRCPDCKCQIKQFVARRYGRLVNRAIVEAMTIRYLSHGTNTLAEIHGEITKLENELVASNAAWKQSTQRRSGENLDRSLQQRYRCTLKLYTRIHRFISTSGSHDQPACKINQAMVLASRKAQHQNLDGRLASLSIQNSEITSTPVLTLILGGQLAQLAAHCVILEDKLSLAIMFRGKLTKPIDEFFGQCTSFIPECFNNDQPKLATEATIIMARIAGAYSTSNRVGADIDGILRHTASAQEHLLDAQKRCDEMGDRIRILGNLPQQLETLIKTLPSYNKLTPAELDSIKSALTSGRDGIEKHSGHWYQCSNGHRVSHSFSHTLDPPSPSSPPHAYTLSNNPFL